ncbi:uncharacterized protein LOC123660946 [Melitaea cinxia]|uniref:uncharacterized protein LOC123660946 n=1 Tax=Melitaea cinxia TaxID=113334 RepID=UPI001E26EA0F|nr:uncharacterized protein LOC123660946 [Melitaea cinxia]
MDKAYEYAKSAIINFKLDRCCCLAPVKVGVLVIGYLNVFIAILSLVGTSDGGITPPLMEVQEVFLEDNASKAIGIIAYSVELGFSVLLLCGMYREDTIILRVYVYFLIAVLVVSLLVYSIIIAAVSLLTKLTLIGNMVFNAYVIILVRSAIVEIKESRNSEKNGHVTLYSVAKVHQEIDVPDVEAPVPETKESNEESDKIDTKKDETPAKVETVDENVKEE